jgi:SanA protein
MSKIIKIVVVLISILFIFVVSVNIYINNNGNDICTLEDTHKQAALVLGARVYSDGSLSGIFQDRVDRAINLYRNNKVEKILVSGDHGQDNYDEVNAAKDYLLEENIKEVDIFLDHAGFDTYDSIYRAKEVFDANSLIIVTQDFHLKRALYIANKLDINSCGVRADLHRYYGENKRQLREMLAKVKAWLDITFNSNPTYLGNQIPLSGSGIESHD